MAAALLTDLYIQYLRLLLLAANLTRMSDMISMSFNTPTQTRHAQHSTPMPSQHSCNLLPGTGLVNMSASISSVRM